MAYDLADEMLQGLQREVRDLEVECDQLRARAEKAEAERDNFRDRLIEHANEEPPSGWLRPGEDGYENTPEGARERAARAEADCKRMREALKAIMRHALNGCEAMTCAALAQQALGKDGTP